MKRKILISIFSLVLMLSFGSVEQVLACSCVPSAPCQNYDRADVVFVGKVVGSKFQRTVNDYDYSENANSSVPTEPKKVTYDVGEVYFQVEEAFQGAEKDSKVTIFSNTGGGDCGFGFRRGESYVVFASKENSNSDSGISSLTHGGSMQQLKPNANRLWTTLCSGTRDIKGGEETLDYLRNLPKDGLGGMIIGRIDESIKDYSDENLTGKPMVDTKIKAQQVDGEKKIFYGTSNKNGYFEIKVPVGKYLVSPELSPYLLFSSRYESEEEETKPLEIKDKRCDSKIFWVSNDSEIKGKVVDSNGKLVQGISLEFIPVGKSRGEQKFDYKFDYVGEDGLFSFKGVPLGRYQISLNYTDKPEDDSPYPTYFYPNTDNRNEAKVFEIGYGTKFGDLVFQMPPKLIKRNVSGQVVWKNGKPAVNAEVKLEDVEFNRDAFFTSPRTNAKGEFSFDWFKGRKYRIKVIVWKMSKDKQSGYGIASAETQEFILDEKNSKFRVVLDIINPEEKIITRKTVRAN